MANKNTIKTNELIGKNIERLDKKQREIYDKACERTNYLNEEFNNLTYKQAKAIVNKNIRKGTVYEVADENRNNVFRYIYDMKYTAYMIGKYDGRRYKPETTKTLKNGEEITLKELRTICVVDMYIVIQETEECIHIEGHAWLNDQDGLVKEILRYYFEYGDTKELKGHTVFMPRMKAMKYMIDYKKRTSPDKCKYQLVTASKTKRAMAIKEAFDRIGRTNFTISYIKKHIL